VRRILPFGERSIEADLPDDTRIVGAPPSLPPLEDPAGAVRVALAEPVAHAPLADLVGHGARVTIAFDDPTVTFLGAARPDPRETALGVLLDELTRAGVRPEDVRLICANALHRRWTNGELATVVGPVIPYAFGPARFGCHDACDPEQLAYLGMTERGFEVEVSRAILDADQFVYLNVSPSPFNGGWKSTVVGLSSFRSIRHHHRPFPFATGRSVMDPRRSAFPKLLAELGRVLEKSLADRGRRLLQLECVLTSDLPGRPAFIAAGHPPEVHDRTIEALHRQHVVPVEGQTDALLLALPDADPYSALSHPNPILMANAALGYAFALHMRRPLVHREGFVIVANPFTLRFHPRHHRSYPEAYEALAATRDAVELWDSHAEDFAARPEYVHAYRYQQSFHGAHPLFLWGQVMRSVAQVAGVLVAGGDPDVCARLGFRAEPSVETALEWVGAQLGRRLSLTWQPLPPLSIPEVRLPGDDGEPGGPDG